MSAFHCLLAYEISPVQDMAINFFDAEFYPAELITQNRTLIKLMILYAQQLQVSRMHIWPKSYGAAVQGLAQTQAGVIACQDDAGGWGRAQRDD